MDFKLQISFDQATDISLGKNDVALVFSTEKQGFVLTSPDVDDDANVSMASMLLFSFIFRMKTDEAWAKDHLDYISTTLVPEVNES